MNTNVKSVIGARPGSLGACFAGLKIAVVSEEAAAAAQRAEAQRREALAAQRAAAEAAARAKIEAEKAADAAKRLKEQQDAAEASAKAAVFVPKITYMPPQEDVGRAQALRLREELISRWEMEELYLHDFARLAMEAGFAYTSSTERCDVYTQHGVNIYVPTVNAYLREEAVRARKELFRQRKESQPTLAQFTLWVIAARFEHVRDQYKNAFYACEGVEIEIYGGAVGIDPRFAPKATTGKLSPERAKRESRTASNREERLKEQFRERNSTGKKNSDSGNNKNNKNNKKNKKK